LDGIDICLSLLYQIETANRNSKLKQISDMPKQLKREAITEIKSNHKLFSTICDLLDIKPGGLMSNLNRNSERLTQHEVLMAIAKEMGLTPNDILENEFAKAV
jgi:hypothetical protein